MELIAFFVLALLLVASALVVITNRNPVTAAVALAFNLVAIAGVYMVLDAQFIGLLQVIVYAGAIMVLFLFVIMYLNLQHDIETGVQIALRRGLGWLVGGVLAAEAAVLFVQRWAPGPSGGSAAPTRTAIGRYNGCARSHSAASSRGTFNTITTNRNSTMIAPA